MAISGWAMSGWAMLACGLAAAQTAPLPEARDLIERHLRESGGIEALKANRAQTLRGRFTFPRAGLSGKATMIIDGEGRSYTALEAPGGGKLEVVNTGDIEWERSAAAGVKVRRVASSAGSLLRPAPGSASFWNFGAGPRTVGKGTFDGRPCWQVEAQRTMGGQPLRLCFDWDSGLLVEVSVEGEVALTLREYKQVGALRMPYRIEQGTGDGMMQVDVDDIRLGEEPPEDLFEVPGDVRELARRQAGEVEFKEPQEDPNRPRLKRKKR